MDLVQLRNRIHKKRYRREHRRHVRHWWADGGDERFRFDYPLTRDSVVLDLGGYEGQWASDLYGRFRCKISVFEPVGQYAENIRRRFAHNDDISVFEFGLGASNRTETIYIRGAGSSAYGKKAEADQMQMVDVNDWFDENSVKNIDLMKINIEGGEYELLERMIKCNLISRIRDIQVQFHNITPESMQRMQAIQASLGKTHSLSYQYKFVWENWSRNGDDVKG